MEPIEYFPLGIARGRAFCNRKAERKQLLDNFKAGQHSIIISPRRYGKSSLALNAISTSGLTYEHIDLFVAINEKTIEEKILKGIRGLIGKVTAGPVQAISILKNYFKQLKSKWIIGTDGISIELTPDKESDSATNILEALEGLEKLLIQKKKQAIFFIDEFQEIGALAKAKGIEGAIRNVAQKSRNIIFVFSGSNRHILSNMIDDRSRPLYMLCDRINLSRIDKTHYQGYLNKVSKMTWEAPLEQDKIDMILKLTECHPYYVNALCNKIWLQYDFCQPAVKDINKTWNNYVLQEETRTAREISLLSEIQKKVLVTIAKGQTNALTTKSILEKLNVSSSAIVKTLNSLNEKDYICRLANGDYQIIDPALKTSLQFFYQ